MAITAQDVNKLRQQTGAGMMDCKKALEENDGDFEKAIDFLRKKGAKVAANRGDRESKEGVVLAKTTADNKKGILIWINCETDFVAINSDFIAFVNKVADVALVSKASSKDEVMQLSFDGNSVADKLMEQVAKIGEKIEIGCFEVIEADYVSAYIHPGNRVSVIVGFNKAIENEVGRNVAMQAAAMAPVALDKDSVTPAMLERELEIAREQIRAEGKPEDMIEKIAQGKIAKFYKESTLLNQEYIKDNKLTVLQYLQSINKDLKATAFKRYALS